MHTANDFSANVFAFFALWAKSSLADKFFFSFFLLRYFHVLSIPSSWLAHVYQQPMPKWKKVWNLQSTQAYFSQGGSKHPNSRLVTDQTLLNTHRIIFNHTTSLHLHFNTRSHFGGPITTVQSLRADLRQKNSPRRSRLRTCLEFPNAPTVLTWNRNRDPTLTP